MADKQLPDISVGDFAQNILSEMGRNPKESLRPKLKEATLGEDKSPDYSKIKVDESFVDFAIGTVNPKLKSDKKVNTKVVQEEKQNLQEQTESLIEEFSTIVKRARQIIEELTAGTTSVGNIGVNLAGGQKKKKKKKSNEDNPWAICHSSTGPKKSSKFERCVKKVKSQYK